MSILKNKFLTLVLLTIFGIGYFMITRGKQITKLEQSSWIGWKNNQIQFSKKLSLQTDYFISTDSSVLGSHSYFKITDTCITLRDLSIKIFQDGESVIDLPKLKTRISDLDNFEFDSLYNVLESNLNDSVPICSDKRISVTNWFKYDPKNGNNFRTSYKLNNGKPISKTLKKKTSFEIVGLYHSDYIILFYPVLWIFLAILISIKIYQLYRAMKRGNGTAAS